MKKVTYSELKKAYILFIKSPISYHKNIQELQEGDKKS